MAAMANQARQPRWLAVGATLAALAAALILTSLFGSLGLLISIVLGAALAWGVRHAALGRSAAKGLLIALLFSGASVVLGLVLLGLPGALIYEVAVHLVLGHGADDLKPDAAWPLAIAMSLFWPLGVPFGWLLARLAARFRGGAAFAARTLVLLGVECAWVLAVALLLHHAAKAA